MMEDSSEQCQTNAFAGKGAHHYVIMTLRGEGSMTMMSCRNECTVVKIYLNFDKNFLLTF